MPSNSKYTVGAKPMVQSKPRTSNVSTKLTQQRPQTQTETGQEESTPVKRYACRIALMSSRFLSKTCSLACSTWSGSALAPTCKTGRKSSWAQRAQHNVSAHAHLG